MRITVAIPTHNRRQTLLCAIESVRRQSRPADQIIVIADGCSDGSQEAVAALGDDLIEVLDMKKAFGPGYANRNEALRHADGEVICWLADDDLYLPDHLEAVGALHDTGEVDLVQAMACVVHEDSSLSALGMDWRIPYSRRLILKGQNRTPASAVSHRVGAAIEAGGWPERMRRRGDMDLWQRMLRNGARTAMVSQATVLHLRAAWRRQRYEDRVRQNEALLERMADPIELARLRSELTLAIQSSAASEEAMRKRLLLGAPHLRARVMLRTRIRERRKDRRAARGGG